MSNSNVFIENANGNSCCQNPNNCQFNCVYDANGNCKCQCNFNCSCCDSNNCNCTTNNAKCC